MTLDERLKEIEKRANAATQGPWYPCGCRYTMISRDLNEQEAEDIAEVCNHFRDEQQIEENKQFIAHARTDVPTLLAMLRLAIEQRNCWKMYKDGYKDEMSVEEMNAELAAIADKKEKV